MDRNRLLQRLLIPTALLLVLAAAADKGPLPLSEARWLPRERLLDALSSQPRECLRPAGNEAERQAIAIGRAAFGAPLLLGGQAARAGLSCSSCHKSGRGNPDFTFPGLSAGPGTADVTSSVMSSHRGDGTHNPKPIPDLADPPRLASHDRQSRALERFIRGLIVEEFDGREPTPAVLRGLAEYVRAVDPKACRTGGREPVMLEPILSDARAALAAALPALHREDRATAIFLVGAARSQLGRIDERFRLPGLQRSRELLRQSDRELAEIAAAIRAGSGNASQRIQVWNRDSLALTRELKRQERGSLFSKKVLRRLLRSKNSSAIAPVSAKVAGGD